MTFDPSSLFDVTHAATFLGGTAVGAAGKYIADLFTDQRHKKEARAAERQGFLKVQKAMPGLLAEMKEDLFRNQSLHLREFIILPSPNITFNHDTPRMQFYESKHPSARNQVVTLLSEGYVEIVKEGQCPIYRLKEPFVLLLTNDA
jgi:hypothetical protein